MAPKGKELTPDVKEVIIDLSNHGFSGKKIGELLDVKPRTVQNFLKPFHEVTLKIFREVEGKKDAQRETAELYYAL